MSLILGHREPIHWLVQCAFGCLWCTQHDAVYFTTYCSRRKHSGHRYKASYASQFIICIQGTYVPIFISVSQQPCSSTVLILQYTSQDTACSGIIVYCSTIYSSCVHAYILLIDFYTYWNITGASGSSAPGGFFSWYIYRLLVLFLWAQQFKVLYIKRGFGCGWYCTAVL